MDVFERAGDKFERVEVKQMAREQIKGKIGILFVCTLVLVVVIGIPNYIVGTMAETATVAVLNTNIAALMTVLMVTMLATLAIGLITPALSMGLTMIYLGLTRNEEPKVGDVFKGFSIFGKAWWLSFITGFFIMLWSMLLVIPGIVKTYAYSMAPYILADNPTMTAREALRESKRITDGGKIDLFVLELSFIGWGLLCVITFGIAGIYVVPYMQATYANVYQKLKAQEPTATPVVEQA